MILSAVSSYSKIHITELEDGKLHFKDIVDFKPEIFIETDSEEEWKDLVSRRPLKKIQFNKIKEYFDYKNKYKDLMMLYNEISPEYQYIRAYNTDVVNIPKVLHFDIETGKCPITGGFSKPDDPTAEITLIQIKESTGKKHIFGWMMDYISEDPDTTYHYCSNEKDMLLKFRDYYLQSNSIILNAWFGSQYDYPYLVNRCIKNDIAISSFSHFKKTKTTTGMISGERVEYDVPIEAYWLDTVDVYKSLVPGGREQWSLDFICNYHGVPTKLDFKSLGFKTILHLIEGEYDPKYDTEKNSALYHAYKTGDIETVKKLSYNIFCQYGELDVDALYNLEAKLNFYNILTNVSHKMGINIDDSLATIHPWVIYIYNYLYDSKIAIQSKSTIEHVPFAGGYVYSNPGRHQWVVVADYSGLYPSIQIECNISVDTFVHPDDVSKELRELTRDMFENQMTCEDIFITKSPEVKKRIYELCREENLVLGINGVFYTKEYQGLLPRMLEELARTRDVEKVNIYKYKEALENLDNKEQFPIIKDKLVKSDLASKSYKKISNSEYGAVGNKALCISNPYVASSITSYGRFSIKTTTKYVVNKMNKKYNVNTSCVQIDTDSGFFEILDIVNLRFKDNIPTVSEVVDFIIEFVKKFLNPVIDESSQRNKKIVNAYKDFLEMDIEVISRAMISTGKKRYAMTVDAEDLIKLLVPKKKITGIEIKRSSSPAIIRTKLTEALDLIFDKTNDDLVDFIDDFREKYMKREYTIDEIAIPMGISDITKYQKPQKSTPIHVRAALVHNEYIKDKNIQPIVNGDKIKWCYLKEPNSFNSNVIGWLDLDTFEDINLYDEIDLNTMFEKTFMSPLRKLIVAIGWNEVKLSKGVDLF